MRVAGIDVWRKQWIAVVLCDGRYEDAVVQGSLDGFAELAGMAAIGIDMPFGLTSGSERREADALAREFVGPRGSAVFPTYPREVYEAQNYDAARETCLKLTTTRRIAKELLRSGREPRDRSERMILNNYRALQFMRDDMGDRLTPALVAHLQEILTEGTLDDPAGSGRMQSPDEDRVVVSDDRGEIIHRPPPAMELPDRMHAICDFANQPDDDDGVFMHPVIRAALLHFWLAYDHPFQDGNGRTARALFYWYMRTRGYWLVEYLSISRILRKSAAKYSRAFLYAETDRGDTTYFVLHQLEVIKEAVDELQVYLRRKVKEVQDVERMIKSADEFNHRQLALLGDVIRHPDNTYTYRSHAASHKVSEETARADLAGLSKRGLMKQRRSGKTHVYSATPNLTEALVGQ